MPLFFRLGRTANNSSAICIARHRAADGENALFAVKVIPTESSELSRTHTEGQHQAIERMPHRIVGHVGQNSVDLRLGPCFDRFAFCSWQVDSGSRGACKDFQIDCLEAS